MNKIYTGNNVSYEYTSLVKLDSDAMSALKYCSEKWHNHLVIYLIPNMFRISRQETRVN